MIGTRNLSIYGMTVLLGGCAAVPAPPEYDGIKVSQIVDAVQCELAAVYNDKKEYTSTIRNWVANVQLTLKVVNDASTKPTVTIIPVVASGALTIPIGPDLADQSARVAQVTFDVHLGELNPKILRYSPTQLPECGQYTGLPEAAYGLGLTNWVSTVAESIGRRDFASFDGAVYDLMFTVTRGAHGGVTFQNIHVNVDATGSTISKSNNNHLVVTLVEDKKAVVAGRKARTSDDAKAKILIQRLPFETQRFILQSGTGRLTQ